MWMILKDKNSIKNAVVIVIEGLDVSAVEEYCCKSKGILSKMFTD